MRYRYEVPQGLTDETKWFRFFNKRSLVVFLCVGALVLPLMKLLGGFGITFYVIVFWSVITIMATSITIFKIPATNWMNGGGEYIDQFLIKRLIRSRNRRLYIKGYDQLFYEQMRVEEEREEDGK